jgi:hypothetical protein
MKAVGKRKKTKHCGNIVLRNWKPCVLQIVCVNAVRLLIYVHEVPCLSKSCVHRAKHLWFDTGVRPFAYFKLIFLHLIT